MISHRLVMKNVAQSIAATADIRTYCITNFGRGLEVCVGAYPQLAPDESHSPFLWITPKEENGDVNQDETFTVRMVVGGCVKGSGGEKVIVNTITPRTASANGVIVNGGNEIVEDLRDKILTAVLSAKAGARVVAVRKVENDIAHFPLEWAEIYIDYFEPAALD